MLKENHTIFEYKDRLDTHNEQDDSYKYYKQKYEARRNLVSVLGTPFFGEIKCQTEGIQKVLKDYGYENVDGLLKALIIDGIKLFLNLDYEINVQDDILYDDYFLGLFDSLGINTNNKELLNEILSELTKGGEELPESPINILVEHKYKYDKPESKENSEQKDDNKQEKQVNNSKEGNLQRIKKDFWDKDYGVIKDLRKNKVKEEELEDRFLLMLYGGIIKLLNDETISSRAKNRVFSYYGINIHDKQLLISLKEEIESHFKYK